MVEYGVSAPWRTFYLMAARALTLARLASIPLFLWLLIQAPAASTLLEHLRLPLLYAAIALSDFFDGRLARKAGGASHVWGQLDATADIVFTTCSLGAAAWLGRVGPWVPSGVALLGGRFLWRNVRRRSPSAARLVEDRAGKAAGVIYYLLVGAVTIELSSQWQEAQWFVARLGDVVFLYTLFLLLPRRKGQNSPA